MCGITLTGRLIVDSDCSLIDKLSARSDHKLMAKD